MQKSIARLSGAARTYKQQPGVPASIAIDRRLALAYTRSNGAEISGIRETMIDARLRKNLDFPLIGMTYLVVAMGLLTIYSATHGTTGRFLQKQLFAVGLGTAGMC